MEDQPAKADTNGGRHPPMSLDLYTIVGYAAIASVAGILVLKLARDEASLRRKMPGAGKPRIS
jgi:hypothetical protein